MTLHYFDFHGGRGEPARLAMHLGGIEFEDHRIPFDRWSALKQNLPFRGIPILEIDGQAVSQCNAINRYVGKLAGLYPTDPWECLRCDEAMDAVEDIDHKVVASFFLTDGPEKQAAREELATGPIPVCLQGLQDIFEAQGGEYFADQRLTMADLKVFVWIRHLRSGQLDHIPVDVVQFSAPMLVDHCERIANHPGIVSAT